MAYLLLIMHAGASNALHSVVREAIEPSRCMRGYKRGKNRGGRLQRLPVEPELLQACRDINQALGNAVSQGKRFSLCLEAAPCYGLCSSHYSGRRSLGSILSSGSAS